MVSGNQASGVGRVTRWIWALVRAITEGAPIWSLMRVMGKVFPHGLDRIDLTYSHEQGHGLTKRQLVLRSRSVGFVLVVALILVWRHWT